MPSSPRGGRADDRREAAPHGFLQRRDVDLDDFADISDVDLLPGIILVVEVKLPAFEDVRPGEADRLAAERVDGLDDLGIDLARKDVVHDLRRGLIGDALALDETGLQAGFLHRAGDGLAAAVDDDGVDLDGFQKDDVARDPGAHGFVRRIHETAAVLHHERLTGEFLDVRQRFKKHIGFGNEVLHPVYLKEFRAK